jgi:hypothetical protein
MNIGVHKQEQNIIGQKQPGISRRPLYAILWLASRVLLQIFGRTPMVER